MPAQQRPGGSSIKDGRKIKEDFKCNGHLEGSVFSLDLQGSICPIKSTASTSIHVKSMQLYCIVIAISNMRGIFEGSNILWFMNINGNGCG